MLSNDFIIKLGFPVIVKYILYSLVKSGEPDVPTSTPEASPIVEPNPPAPLFNAVFHSDILELPVKTKL